MDKYYYKATTAFRQYKTILVESRTGINISEADLKVLDEMVTPLVLQGQSPYTILNNHPEIGLSEKTLYNYIEQGVLSVKNIDLPKKVAYKVRNVHKTEINDSRVFEGRTFKDYQEYIKAHPDTPVVEMDTVVGCEGSHKVLLTLHFASCSFMVLLTMRLLPGTHRITVVDTGTDHVIHTAFQYIRVCELTPSVSQYQREGKAEFDR